MGLSIENITTQNDYVPANTFGQATPIIAGWYIVANAVAAVQLTTGIHGQPTKQEEVICPPGIYPIQSNQKNPITTIAFRSFVAGTPAQVVGAVFYPSDSFIQSGGAFDSQITPGGGIVPPTVPGTVLAYQELLAPVLVNNAALPGDVIVTLPSIALTGAQVINVEFWAPRVDSPGAAPNDAIGLVLLENGVVIANPWGIIQPSIAGAQRLPVKLERRLSGLAAGNYVYEVQATITAPGPGFVFAGVGGAADYAPAYGKVVQE